MKSIKEIILKDTTLLVGIGLTVFSLLIFFIPDWFHQNQSDGAYFGIFMLNYLISIIYFVVIWIREVKGLNLKLLCSKIEYGFIHLNLSLISAFSLNRELPVFERSVQWLQVLLVVQGVVVFLSFVKYKFPKVLLLLYWILMGLTFSLFFYYACLLIPLFGVGMVLALALGISLHALVPLFYAITLILYLFRRDNLCQLSLAGFSCGILISVLLAGYGVFQWSKINNVIQKSTDRALMDTKNDLPEWVIVAENLPQNDFTEKVLKTGLVYSMAPEAGDIHFFRIPQRSFDEEGKHDPIVMISTFILGRPNLSTDDKLKILESLYDSRHKTQERLWNGADLKTRHVVSNIRLYPSLRMAYTEKIITVKNLRSFRGTGSSVDVLRSANDREEAIYTFHLPEGTVVTSLSLWIDGKEQPGVLCSKNKADSAYNTTVGVEQHDPSLVRWQEGNTVSVRVFPCTPYEDRKFKIGFTSPLEIQNNSIKYTNIWFDGPEALSADESSKIFAMEDVDDIKIPAGFAMEGPNTWFYDGKYNPDLSIEFPVNKISDNCFAFGGYAYRVKEHIKEYENFAPENLYLDVNKDWTFGEFETIRRTKVNTNVFVYYNGIVRLNDKNARDVFNSLTKTNYTIFPVYKISDPQKSILITKGGFRTPNVKDLGESEFASKLKDYLSENHSLRLFSIGNQLSPYLKTLKEMRCFNYDSGNLTDLQALLKKNQFVKNIENENNIVINNAGIVISKTKESAKNDAPDHLMRLFAYNHIMYHIGNNYFSGGYPDSSNVAEAHESYVVSPLTNLIVLESQKDYDRFNIKDDGTSLKNASMKTSGAVPEPHEWALIIILLLLSGYLYTLKRQQITNKSHSKNIKI